MKKMPFSLEAEQSVLGAILIDERVMQRALQRLYKTDFYKVSHAHIYDAMETLSTRKIDLDYATIISVLEERNLVEEIGGIDYLLELANLLPTAENVDSYIDIVKNKSLARQVIQMATNIAEQTYEQQLEIGELFDYTEQQLFEVTKQRKSVEFRPIGSVVNEVISGIEKHKNKDGFLVGLPTGYLDLDDRTLGFQDGNLIILAARPSVGKSAFAINLAYNIAEKNNHVAFFSLEMSAEQIVTRMLSTVSSINNQALQSGNINSRQWRQVEHAATLLSRLNIYFDDAASSNVGEVYTKCRQLKQENKLDFVVIDYLQLLTGTGNYGGNRVVEVSEISRRLKNLARDLGVPVLALSQLSRNVEQRTDKRPNMADLRESGSIEQDADIVMFMYRDDYYNPETTSQPNIVEISISKNRSGATGKFDLLFVKDYGSFRNVGYRGEDND
jgi:replicative DNA helicase